MSVEGLRRLRIWLSVGVGVLVTVLLFPVLQGVGIADGADAAPTYSAENVLGWPLIARGSGYLVWLAAVLLAVGSVFGAASAAIARRSGPTSRRPR